MSLKKSNKENPLTQQELLNAFKLHKEETFGIIKIPVDTKLTKVAEGASCKTYMFARNGDQVEESSNTAKGDGFVLDEREFSFFHPDIRDEQGNPIKDSFITRFNPKNYDLGDRSWEDVKVGESIDVKTTGGETRYAMVANEDTYIMAPWGEVQLITAGGLIMLMEGKNGLEVGGTNNPSNFAFVNKLDENGKLMADSVVMKTPLSSQVYELRDEFNERGITPSAAVTKAFEVFKREDNKNPYKNQLALVRRKLARKIDKTLGTSLTEKKLPTSLKNVESKINKALFASKERYN